MNQNFFSLSGHEGAWITLAVVGLVFVLLTISTLGPDIVLMGAVVLLVAAGVLTPSDAIAGLSNEAMVVVAILFIVSAGIRETGGIDWLAQRILGRPRSPQVAIAKLSFSTAFVSAFVNNTPLVAMLIPAVNDWGKKNRVALSKLMIPLSYAAILGGTCTLIGTSTNLVVDGLLREWLKTHEGRALQMFDISPVGIPAAIVGCLYMVFFSRWLLPDRRPAMSQLDDPREYTIEMLVPPESPLVNQTIEQAGLRHLPGMYLLEIDRSGVVLPAVAPDQKLQAGDRLVFVGVVESVVDLQKMRGLVVANDQVFKLTAPRTTRCLTEAVVSNTCPLVGQTIRESRFRTHYNAAVVAVARNGERLRQKIGDIVLQPGDTLLLESHRSFVDEHRNRRDFFLVSRLEDSHPPRHDRALVALGIFVGMIVLVGIGWMTMLKAGMLAAALMLLTRCVSAEAARRSIDLETLLAIAASFGIGRALESTGAARLIADPLISMASGDAWVTLAVVYLTTLVVTELITNNAAAALMFPFAMAAADNLHVSYMPFIIVIMMAASNGFATPIGYQTNLMVYGPGGYRFGDYVRIGVPLDLLIAVISIALTPLVFPF